MKKVGVLRENSSEAGDRWKAPDNGWVKINVDGACRAGGRETACGGVLRDSMGYWLGGFAYHAGPGSIISAELLAILLGLQEAKEKGLEQVVIESNSEEALSLLEHGCLRQHPCYHLVQQILEMLDTGWSVRLSPVYREQNKVAAGLARLALHQRVSVRQMKDPPADCMVYLLEDRARRV